MRATFKRGAPDSSPVGPSSSSKRRAVAPDDGATFAPVSQPQPTSDSKTTTNDGSMLEDVGTNLEQLTTVLEAFQPHLLEIRPDAMASFMGRDLRSGTAADHVAAAVPQQKAGVNVLRTKLAARESELTEATSRVRHISNQADAAAKVVAAAAAAATAAASAAAISGGGAADGGGAAAVGGGGDASSNTAVAVADADDGDDDRNEEEQTCVICLDLLDNPVLTTCSHMFCEECISEHLKRASDESKSCPTCRQPLKFKDLVKVDMEPQPELPPVAASDDLALQYGSKIAALVRDLQRRVAADGSFKAVVFSAWSNFIRIVEQVGCSCVRDPIDSIPFECFVAYSCRSKLCHNTEGAHCCG
jgi:hypothetical protein